MERKDHALASRVSRAMVRALMVTGALSMGMANEVFAEESAPAPDSQSIRERALPPGATCKITTYYSTAQQTQEVGRLSTCPGPDRGMKGRKTAFYEVETIQIGSPGPGGGPHGGPGKLPCEFLASGCSNLPEARH